MPKLIILGSANAVPAENHENTHMILVGKERRLLIDCVSNPILRLERAGVDPNTLTDLILTHFHPDHVSGVPLLLMDTWLMGRRQPLNVYGLDHTIDRTQRVMAAYAWEKWPNFFPVLFERLPEEERTILSDCEEWRVLSSPVCHLIPTIGLRIEFPHSGKILAYSSDTEPCQQVVRLAENADMLIHECTSASPGHSSASQAGEVAAQAGAKSLLLIHYNARSIDPEYLTLEARKTFGGEVKLAQDFMEIQF